MEGRKWGSGWVGGWVFNVMGTMYCSAGQSSRMSCLPTKLPTISCELHDSLYCSRQSHDLFGRPLL